MFIVPFVGIAHCNRVLTECPHILRQLIFELGHLPSTHDVVHQVLTEEELGLVASRVILRDEMRGLLWLAPVRTTPCQKGIRIAVSAVNGGRGRQ